MNLIWRQLAIASNWPVLAAVALLSAAGIVTLWADPAAETLRNKQLLFLGAGVACMILLQTVSYLEIGRWSWGFYLVSLALLIYTVAPGVPRHGLGSVPAIHGARAWIDLGVLHLEPAELMKIAFCMVLARYLRFRSNYRTVPGLLAPFGLALAPVILILRQPALGMAMLFLPTLLVMLFVAGAKARHLFAVLGMGLAVLPVLWLLGTSTPGVGRVPLFFKPYQWQRVEGMFVHDAASMQSTGFQAEQALIAYSSGGFWGKGVGHIPVGAHVPEAHNDMIYALIGEQLGFFGSALLLLSYLVLFAAGTEIAAATREPFGRLVAIGIVSMLAGQTFLNLLVTTRLMPVTGITLPFVSYGGSSMLASFLAAGLLLNIGQNRPLIIGKDSFEFEES